MSHEYCQDGEQLLRAMPGPGNVRSDDRRDHQVFAAASPVTIEPDIEVPLNRPLLQQPPPLPVAPRGHMNIVCASLSHGGAERIIFDQVTALTRSGYNRPTVNLFILHDRYPDYELPSSPSLTVYRLAQVRSNAEKMRQIAAEILASPSRIAYTHLVGIHDSSALWTKGIKTIPVIHNGKSTWKDLPGSFPVEHIPFVVAASEQIEAELAASSCRVPVYVLRHELQRWMSQEEFLYQRERVRREHGIRESCFLIGMVGHFKAHKAYTRAVRILQGVLSYRPAKLMIIGGWDQEYGGGPIAHSAVCRLALDLDVAQHLIMPGAILSVEPYYAAFDAFLNTSIYEGVSIATLEAMQSGCPVVSADAGGQREVLGPNDYLIREPGQPEPYVRALVKIARQKRKRSRLVLSDPPFRDRLVPGVWKWLVHHGAAPATDRGKGSVLFVTNNLNVGGPQRSLVNLLSGLGHKQNYLCILNELSSKDFAQSLENAGVPVFALLRSSGTMQRVEDILAFLDNRGIKTVCFWNVDPNVKLLLTKILLHRKVRLVDVSPGPLLFREMDQVEEFSKRICFSAEQYFSRLDIFVTKYSAGTIPKRYGDMQHKTYIIPNGVPSPQPLPAVPELVRPEWADPQMAVITCCRIAPSKRVELALDVASELSKIALGATLTVVGGVDQRHQGYWDQLVEKHRSLALSRIVRFAGCRTDVSLFLRQFKVFLMLSSEQGCPNSSLEAMAAGLPVVATDVGGTSEQIQDGVTGFLVRTDDAVAIANRIRDLLVRPDLAEEMGRAGQRKVSEDFSMRKVIDEYSEILYRNS